VRKHRGLPEVDAMDFLQIVKEKMKLLKMDDDLLKRPSTRASRGARRSATRSFRWPSWNEAGRAGRDRFRSGYRRLRIVANGVNSLRGKERSMVVITHHQRLLEYIVPDKVHVLFDGRIVKSGGKELALDLEAKGYGWIEEEQKQLQTT